MTKQKKLTWKEQQKIRPRVKEGISKNAFLRPKEATKTAKHAYKQAKKSYRLARKAYKIKNKTMKKLLQDGESEQTINHLLAKKKYVELKNKRIVQRKIYKKTKAKDPTRVSVQLKQEVKGSVKQEIGKAVTKALHEDDTLREVAQGYTSYQQMKQKLRLSMKTSKTLGRVNWKVAKSTYGLGNRLFNFSRGRGFQRTPKDDTIRSQLMKKVRNAQQRRRAAKAARKAQRGFSLVRSFLNGKQSFRQVAKLIFTNPISWFVLLGFFLLFLFSNVSSNTIRPAIVQEEQDLTEAWTYMTKLDAKNSDTANLFYTNLDDVMFYMNERFDEYRLTDYATSTMNCASFLSQLWVALNGKAPDYSLKRLSDLVDDKKSAYFLSTERQKEYRERVETFGYQTLDGQLTFPFPTESLVVTRRYGYERHGETLSLNRKIEVMGKSGTAIQAPMTGKVTAIPTDSSLQLTADKDHRLLIEGVQSQRVRVGDTIREGELLGNSTNDHLAFYYECYSSSEKRWVSVNPAFYFPKVSYTQTTVLAQNDFAPGKDIESRAKAVYDSLTKMGFTREGIAAILGNFSVESGVNPKRAEGDYLPPPVGKSGHCWEDANWLAMGDKEIYNGRFPNILHRGLGFGQWTDTADGGRRHTLLLDYAKAKKKKWYALDLQLDFIFNGDVPAYRTFAKNVAGSKVAGTVPELTVYFLTQWEGNPGDKVTERVQAAQNWYNFLGSNQDLNKGSKEVFEKYKNKVEPLPTDKEMKQGWSGNAYAPGNCTWYCYNRMKQLGKSIYPYMGNANQWVHNYTQTPGARLVDTPRRGDAVIFTNGVANSSPLYGHVAMIEYVNSDGSFVISEMNVQGEYSMGWRVLKKEAGEYFMRVE